MPPWTDGSIGLAKSSSASNITRRSIRERLREKASRVTRSEVGRPGTSHPQPACRYLGMAPAARRVLIFNKRLVERAKPPCGGKDKMGGSDDTSS